MYHKNDAFDKFEEISALVKRSHLSFSDPKRDYEVNDAKSRKSEADIAREAWITKSRNLLNEVSFICFNSFLDPGRYRNSKERTQVQHAQFR